MLAINGALRLRGTAGRAEQRRRAVREIPSMLFELGRTLRPRPRAFDLFYESPHRSKPLRGLRYIFEMFESVFDTCSNAPIDYARCTSHFIADWHCHFDHPVISSTEKARGYTAAHDDL